MSDSIVRAVEAIYDAAGASGLWPTALQAIADCFDAVGATLQDQRDDGTFAIINSSALDAAIADYSETWWRHDVCAMRALENDLFARRGYVLDTDVTTPAERRTLPFFTEFMAKHHLGPSLGVVAAPLQKIIVCLGILRRHGGRAFSSAEVERARTLAKHVEKALHLSVRLAESDLISDALSRSVVALGAGAVLVDDEGRVVFSNGAAEKRFSRDVRIINRKLTPKDASARAALDAALAEVVRSGARAAPRPILIAPKGVPRHVLHVLAATTSANVAPVLTSFKPTARALVLIIECHSDGGHDVAAMQALFQLTPAEARLAALMANGASPKDAAAELGITPDTARVVLKRVFAKVGVSRQSALTAVLGRVLLRTTT